MCVCVYDTNYKIIDANVRSSVRSILVAYVQALDITPVSLSGGPGSTDNEYD